MAAYEKSSERDSLYDIADQFSAYDAIDAKLKIEIIKEVIKKYKYEKTTGAFIHRQVYSKMELSERLLFVKGILKVLNPEVKKLNFRFDEKFGHLDISHNKKMIWAYALQNFPAKTINSSHTPTYSLRILRSIPIMEIDASYTNLRSLKDVQIHNLRTLNVAHSQIIDLSPFEVFAATKTGYTPLRNKFSGTHKKTEIFTDGHYQSRTIQQREIVCFTEVDKDNYQRVIGREPRFPPKTSFLFPARSKPHRRAALPAPNQ